MTTHRCHAWDCARKVPPAKLFCLTHWRSLRPETQRAVWAEYRPRQEKDKRASVRYLAVQRFAVAEVAERGGAPAEVVERFLERAESWARTSIDAGWGDPLESLRDAVSRDDA